MKTKRNPNTESKLKPINPILFQMNVILIRKGRKRTNTNNWRHNIWLYILSPGQAEWRELQISYELFLVDLFFIEAWAKHSWKNFTCFIGLSKWISGFMSFGARVLPLPLLTIVHPGHWVRGTVLLWKGWRLFLRELHPMDVKQTKPYWDLRIWGWKGDAWPLKAMSHSIRHHVSASLGLSSWRSEI